MYFIFPHSQSCTELPDTTLYATLVPACAVLLLLLVVAAIAIGVKRRRRRRKHSVTAKSMDRIEMKSTNLEIEQGFMNKLRGIFNCFKTLASAVCNICFITN